MPGVSRVGSLRNKITIQNTDRTTDNHGGFSTGRSTYVTAFAKITPKAGRQIFNESTGERIQTHIHLNF